MSFVGLVLSITILHCEVAPNKLNDKCMYEVLACVERIKTVQDPLGGDALLKCTPRKKKNN